VPEVAAALVLAAAIERLDPEGGAVLGEPDGLGGDDLLALVERLPGGPPGAAELCSLGRKARELVDRDTEGVSQSDRDREDRLLLAAFVAADLA